MTVYEWVSNLIRKPSGHAESLESIQAKPALTNDAEWQLNVTPLEVVGLAWPEYYVTAGLCFWSQLGSAEFMGQAVISTLHG